MKRLLILLAAMALCGGLALAQQPAIAANGVQDAASNTADIAQGSIFVVKGTNLSAAGYNPGSAPYTTTLAGVRITFTPVSGGSGTDAFMVYTYNQSGVNQLSGILPSTVAPGAYNVTVNNNSAVSAPARTNVVARKFAIFTVSSTGSGRAIVQNYISQTQLDLNRFTTGTIAGFTYSPAKPGQTLILWGTGLGPVSVPDNQAPGAQDLRSQVNVTVNVAGTDIPAAYAGRSPYLPGTDQINFTLPNNIATGCTLPVLVKFGSQTSNATTVSIAAGSANACADPSYPQATLARLDQGGNLVAGSFVLNSFAATITAPIIGSITTNSESISGAFSKYSADQMDDSRGVVPPNGSCYVFRRRGTQTGLLTPAPPAPLDAGASLTLNGPNVNNKSVPRLPGNAYSADLSSSAGGGGIPGLPPGISIPGIGGGGPSAAVIAAGTYTLRGTGGADIGPFSASLTVNQPLKAGATPDNIPRNSPLTVTWTGGGNDLVTVSGVSGTTVPGSSQVDPVFDATGFLCTASASAGTLTVPVSILSQLIPTPAGGLTSGAGIGALVITSTTNVGPGNGLFSAPLTAGGTTDSGIIISTIGSLKFASFQ